MTMGPELKGYLERLGHRLRLDPSVRGDVLREVYTHIEESAQELQRGGLPEGEAARQATERLGRPEALARQLYEAHSRGSMSTALVAATPHLLMVILFALTLWRSPGGLAAISAALLGGAIYGWWHKRSVWRYPWLGYSLGPLLFAVVASVYITGHALLSLMGRGDMGPSPWVVAVTSGCILLSLWPLALLAADMVRRDWLYGSLTVLPLPAMACWFLAATKGGIFLAYDEGYLLQLSPWVALSFLVLAAGVVAFVYSGRRPFKVGALALSALAASLILAFTVLDLGHLGIAIAAVLSVALLFIPMLVQHGIGHARGRGHARG